MGLFGLFSKGQLSEKKIGKAAKLATNPFAQPDVRMREMQRLLEDGSDQSLRGLLKRFASNAQGHIADEDEKKWLEDALVDQGDSVVEALKDFIGKEQQLTYALRALKRIEGAQRAAGFFLEVLERYGPDEYRAVDAKLQLVLELAEHLGEPGVLRALCPFLLDHSDDVRWAVMDLLERAADDAALGQDALASASNALGELVTSTDTGPRIQQRAAALLCARQWSVPGEAKTLAPALDGEYFLDKKRFVRRRAKGKSN